MMITDLNKELSALFSFFDIVFVIIIVMLKYWSCKSTKSSGVTHQAICLLIKTKVARFVVLKKKKYK